MVVGTSIFEELQLEGHEVSKFERNETKTNYNK